PAEHEEVAVQAPELGMAGRAGRRPIDPRAFERLDRLRIRHLVLPSEARKLPPAARPHGVHEIWIAVTHEVEEGPSLAVLRSHEDERCIRREYKKRGAELLRVERNQRGQAIAASAIPGL